MAALQHAFFFCPDQDAVAQPVGSHQAFHDLHLVNADAREERRKGGKGGLAELAPSVMVATAGAVTGGEVFPLGCLLPRKPARHGPQAARVFRSMD